MDGRSESSTVNFGDVRSSEYNDKFCEKFKPKRVISGRNTMFVLTEGGYVIVRGQMEAELEEIPEFPKCFFLTSLSNKKICFGSAGYTHACFVSEEGKAYYWNLANQLVNLSETVDFEFFVGCSSMGEAAVLLTRSGKIYSVTHGHVDYISLEVIKQVGNTRISNIPAPFFCVAIATGYNYLVALSNFGKLFGIGSKWTIFLIGRKYHFAR